MREFKKNTLALFGFETSTNEEINALAGISDSAKQSGWNVLVYNALKNFTSSNGNELTIDTNIFSLVNYEMISGAIMGQNIMAPFREIGEKLISQCKSHNIPVISMGVYTDSCPSYVFNNSECIEDIVDHLIEKHNCKNFALMAGAPDNPFSLQREEAFKASLKKHNISFDPEKVFYGYFWEGSTKDEMNRFFESDYDLPDAFVCLNDVMAMTVCEELKKRDIKIPEEVIVTGYDGLDAERFYSPRITTAKCDIYNMGKEVFNLLVQTIDGKTPQNRNEMAPTLIFSESCGCKSAANTKESRVAFETMGLIGEFRHTNELLHNFSTMASSCENLASVKNIIPENLFQEGDLWILLNKDFVDIKSDASYTEEKPFDSIMTSFYYKRTWTTYELEPIDKNELIPFIDDYLNEGSKTLVVMDLFFANQSIGYMVVPYSSSNVTNQLNTAERFAQTLSQNLSLVRGREKVEYLIYNDLMTGIHNRRGFYHYFSEAIKKRMDKTCRLILHSIDMDNLKTINDTYGHKEGDFAIISLASAITYAGNETLIAARFGGDEFVAAEFSEFTEDDSDTSISKFREKMQEYLDRINETSGKPYKVGCSIGSHSTTFPPELEVDQIITQADEMMYTEKSHKKRSARRS